MIRKKHPFGALSQAPDVSIRAVPVVRPVEAISPWGINDWSLNPRKSEDATGTEDPYGYQRGDTGNAASKDGVSNQNATLGEFATGLAMAASIPMIGPVGLAKLGYSIANPTPAKWALALENMLNPPDPTDTTPSDDPDANPNNPGRALDMGNPNSPNPDAVTPDAPGGLAQPSDPYANGGTPMPNQYIPTLADLLYSQPRFDSGGSVNTTDPWLYSPTLGFPVSGGGGNRRFVQHNGNWQYAVENPNYNPGSTNTGGGEGGYNKLPILPPSTDTPAWTWGNTDGTSGGRANGGRMGARPKRKGALSTPNRSGLIAGREPGRADTVPARLDPNGYVIPADTVAAAGDGNTSAGALSLARRLGIRPGVAKTGGGNVPAKVSSGEMYLTPQDAARAGGALSLDNLVVEMRKAYADKLNRLPRPKNG